MGKVGRFKISSLVVLILCAFVGLRFIFGSVPTVSRLFSTPVTSERESYQSVREENNPFDADDAEIPTKKLAAKAPEKSFPVDAMYIINQPERTDRLIDTVHMFRHLHLKPTFVDGLNMLPYKNAKYRNPNWKAAMESHRRAIRQVVLNGDRAAIVFEDDIDVFIPS